MSLRDWFTGEDADYDLDDARDAMAAEAREPKRKRPCRFDTCFDCGAYLPLPKVGGLRRCAECIARKDAA